MCGERHPIDKCGRQHEAGRVSRARQSKEGRQVQLRRDQGLGGQGARTLRGPGLSHGQQVIM